MQEQMIINAKKHGLGTFVSEYGTTNLLKHSSVKYDLVKLWFVNF
jgi:hypothetical protein